MTSYQFGTFEITVQLKLPICYISILPIDQPYLYEVEIGNENLRGQLIKTAEKFHEILVDILMKRNRDFVKMKVNFNDDKQTFMMVINLNYPYFSEELIFHLYKNENNVNLLKMYKCQEKVIEELKNEVQKLKFRTKCLIKYAHTSNGREYMQKENNYTLVFHYNFCVIMRDPDYLVFHNHEYPNPIMIDRPFPVRINECDLNKYPITYKYKNITKMSFAKIHLSTNLNFLKYNTKLSHLCLIKSDIQDISILIQMNKLAELYIFECNSIKNLSIIDEIKNLKKLYLSPDIDSQSLSKNKKYSVIIINKPVDCASF